MLRSPPQPVRAAQAVAGRTRLGRGRVVAARELAASMVEAKDVVIIGGGFAGLSAGVALAERGFRVALLESKPALGGRAYSFADPESGDFVDNGQHVLMGCYSETLDFSTASARATSSFSITTSKSRCSTRRRARDGCAPRAAGTVAYERRDAALSASDARASACACWPAGRSCSRCAGAIARALQTHHGRATDGASCGRASPRARASGIRSRLRLSTKIPRSPRPRCWPRL